MEERIETCYTCKHGGTYSRNGEVVQDLTCTECDPPDHIKFELDQDWEKVKPQ